MVCAVVMHSHNCTNQIWFIKIYKSCIKILNGSCTFMHGSCKLKIAEAKAAHAK